MAAVLPYLGMIGGAAQGASGISGSISSYYANRGNAKAAQAEGQSALAAAQMKSDQIARNNRLLTERQFAAYGASGVSPTDGTPLDVMTQDAVQGELDALMAQYEGRVAKQSADYEAKSYRFQAKQNKIAGVLQGIFDPMGIVAKSPGVTSPKTVKAPTIQPGGGSRSNLMAISPEAGYTALS